MLPAASVSGFAASSRIAGSFRVSVAILTLVHLAAFALMFWSETDWTSKTAFVFAWGLMNCGWLLLVKRPSIAAVLSLIVFTVIILLSRFKHETFFLTANFIDVMFIDDNTVQFLLAIFPKLSLMIGLSSLIVVPVMIYAWRADCFRVPRRVSAAAGFLCLIGLAGIAYADPIRQYKEFTNDNYISKFARFGAVGIGDYFTRGLFESDALAAGHLKAVIGECHLPRRAPNILLILDESSFDITAAPGIKTPPNYQNHFRSFDGKQRGFLVEGAGGPTWYTEYNVLTGLSVRSYGRFADSVTRIAAGRVERGLPYALRRCGYTTASIYPWLGNFLGARNFHLTAGIENFYDAKDLGTLDLQPDRFYYDAALRLFKEKPGKQPMFIFAYTMANHLPWNYRLRPELTPDWKNPGNSDEIDEYLRRQSMSARDYKQLIARLKTEFPNEPFLVIRFGDHQPYFGKKLIDPSLNEAAIGRNIADFDPRYFSTYYSIEPVNFRPVSMASAIDTLDAPFLPLVVLETAGVPLDASFAEQKQMFLRCEGRFYSCKDGAEARRFNRLLIEAGLIKGM